MIEFAYPIAFALLGSLPIVWWLLRVRARRIVSDRVDLWRLALARVPRARRRFQWQRLVALLAMIAFTCALAGPRVPERAGIRTRLSVFDTSYSMSSRESGKSRIEVGLERWLRTRPAPGLATAEDLVFALEGDRLRRVDLDAVRAEDGSFELTSLRDAVLRTRSVICDLTPAAVLAQRSVESTLVELVSDGAGASRWPAPGPRFACISIGRGDVPNAALLGVEIEDPWPGPTVKVRLSTLRTPASKAVTATDVGQTSGVRTALATEDPIEIELVRRTPGSSRARVVRLGIDGDRSLAIDDSVRVRLRAAWAPSMLLSPAEVDQWGTLADFLRSTLGAKVARDATEFADEARRRGGLALVDGGALSAWPRDGVVRILFGTQLPGLDERVASMDGLPSWDRGHELLDGLDLTGLRSAAWTTGKGPLPADAERLVLFDGRPLVVRSRAHRVLWFGLRLDDRLVTRPFLPLLLLRAFPGLVEAPANAADSGGEDAARSRVLDPTTTADEAEIAARAAPGGPAPDPVWWRPAVELWRYALGLAGLCVLVLAAFR